MERMIAKFFFECWMDLVESVDEKPERNEAKENIKEIFRFER